MNSGDSMGYKCVNCGKEVVLEGAKVICPFCGYRILVKTRPEFPKKVKAR